MLSQRLRTECGLQCRLWVCPPLSKRQIINGDDFSSPGCNQPGVSPLAKKATSKKTVWCCFGRGIIRDQSSSKAETTYANCDSRRAAPAQDPPLPMVGLVFDVPPEPCSTCTDATNSSAKTVIMGATKLESPTFLYRI